MSDNPVLSDKDRALFRRAVAGSVAAKNGDRVVRSVVSDPVPSPLRSHGLNKAPSPDDLALFQKAMEGVKRLSVDRRPPQRPQCKPVPLRTTGGGSLSGGETETYGSAFDALTDVPEVLWFSRPGLQHLLLRKLRQGRLPVGAELDLHGMTVAEVRPEVDRFLVEAGEFGLRCVRIIHGKGNLSADQRPVLKGFLDRWLRDRAEVLAFSSARREHGGSGAIYVLLRRGSR